MTDPVETDALRSMARSAGLWEPDAILVSAAADEVDRLRAALVEAHAASDGYSQALSEHREQSVLNERRLRSVIENAPHAEGCHAAPGWWPNAGNPVYCTCWKADAR